MEPPPAPLLLAALSPPTGLAACAALDEDADEALEPLLELLWFNKLELEPPLVDTAVRPCSGPASPVIKARSVCATLPASAFFR